VRATVLTTAAVSLLVLGGLLWLEYTIKRDLRELEDWWAERERRRRP